MNILTFVMMMFKLKKKTIGATGLGKTVYYKIIKEDFTENLAF